MAKIGVFDSKHFKQFMPKMDHYIGFYEKRIFSRQK
jgi:hypothetical protein